MPVFVLPLLLLAPAVVLGGVPGFLLGFTAVLLGIDRALGFEGVGIAAAERSFTRLARGRPGEPLAYLADDRDWAAVAPRRRLGLQTIPVASIVGSTDPHKAAVFDRGFRPPDHSRGRWTQLRLAAQRGAALPPISVYRVGEQHFVRDGHHRVSVARSLGADAIEARVVELRAP